MKYLITLLVIIIGFTANAQTCFWQINNNSFYVGDNFIATIVVTDVDVNENPTIGLSEAWSIRFLEKNVVENEEQKSSIFRYSIIPIKGGIQHLPKITIPAHPRVVCADKKLTIKTPENNPNLQLEVKLSSTSCYQYEPIDLYFTWKSAIPLGNLKAVNIDIPVFKQSSLKVFIPSTISNTANQQIGLPVSGNRIIAEIYDAKINEVAYKAMSFKLTIVPQRSGKIEIPASSLLCSYIKQTTSFNRYPAYFDNNLFDTEDSQKYQRIAALSKPIILNVKKLPQENAPTNFSGLFDKFKVQASIEKTNIKTGEPVKLQLKIKDYSYPERFSLPLLHSLFSNNNAFRFTASQPLISIKDSFILVEKNVRINSVNTTTIPSLQIPYFDTNTKQYAYVTTDSIALDVSLGTTMSYASSADSTELVKKQLITKNTKGIHQLYIHPDALSSHAKNKNYWFWMILILFPILFYAHEYLYNQRKSIDKQARKRMRKANKVFQKSALNSNQDIDTALINFINEAFQSGLKQLVPHHLQTILIDNNINTDVTFIKEFYQLYYKDEFSIYESSNATHVKDVKACVHLICKSFLKGKR